MLLRKLKIPSLPISKIIHHEAALRKKFPLTHVYSVVFTLHTPTQTYTHLFTHKYTHLHTHTNTHTHLHTRTHTHTHTRTHTNKHTQTNTNTHTRTSRGSRGKLAGKSVFLQIIDNDNAYISVFSPQHTH